MNPAPNNKDWIATEPIGVELSLSSKTVMLGEPLVLHYSVTSAWPEVVDTYMGMDLEGWLTFRLVNAAGQVVPSLADPRVSNPGGIHSDGARISPQSFFRGHVVLSQRFAMTQVGEYQLSVQVYLPYAPDEREGFIWPEQFEETYGTVFRAEHSFSFSVTDADPKRLREIAEVLADRFIERLPYSEFVQVESLFSMPEEYALQSWKAVAHTPNLPAIFRQDVAKELTRLNSITAADILADMTWRSAQPLESNGLGSTWRPLHNMYFSAAPELKQHLIQLFAGHNQTIDSQPRLITD